MRQSIGNLWKFRSYLDVIFVKPKYTLNTNPALLTGEYVWRSGFSLVNILDGQVFLLLLSTELQMISGTGGIIGIYYELLFCLLVLPYFLHHVRMNLLVILLLILSTRIAAGHLALIIDCCSPHNMRSDLVPSKMHS